MRLVTPPLEVITTTITTRGCSCSTSTWRISAVSSGGAVTTASRLVTCDIISVVLRSAASTSLRTCDRSIGSAGRAQRLLQQLVGVEPVAGVGGHPPGRRVRVAEQAARLQLGQLVADGGRRGVDAAALDQRLRADRMAGGDVLGHHLGQDQRLARRQPGCVVAHRRIVATTSLAMKRPRSLSEMASSPASISPAARSRCSWRRRARARDRPAAAAGRAAGPASPARCGAGRPSAAPPRRAARRPPRRPLQVARQRRQRYAAAPGPASTPPRRPGPR